MCNFESVSIDYGISPQPEHTIVDKWPTRLKLRPGDEGDLEEFWLLLGSDFSGLERYVEWRRAADY